jgi:hypothetical protein
MFSAAEYKLDGPDLLQRIAITTFNLFQKNLCNYKNTVKEVLSQKDRKGLMFLSSTVCTFNSFYEYGLSAFVKACIRAVRLICTV